MTIIEHIFSTSTTLLSLAVAISANAQYGNDENIATIDSLTTIYAHTTDPTEQIQLLNEISLNHYSVDSTVVYSNKLIELAQQYNTPYYEARGCYYLSWAYYCDGKYMLASEMAERGILIADSINNKEVLSLNYYQLANSYTMLNDASMATEYYHKALALGEELHDTTKICDVLKNMAQLNSENMLYDEALECINKSIELEKQTAEQAYISEDYNLMGYTIYQKYVNNKYLNTTPSLLEDSKKYLLISVDLAAKKDYVYGLMRSYTMLAVVLLEQAQIETNATRRSQILDSCHIFINQSYAITDKLGQDSERLDINDAYIKWLIETGQQKNAKNLLDSLKNIYTSDVFDLSEDISILYHNYSLYNASIGNYKLALHYEQMHYEMEQTLKKNDYAAKAARGMAQSNFNKQIREREIHYESATRIHTIIIGATALILILVVIFTFFVIRSYKRSREANTRLDQKNCELEQQKEEMLVQNEYLEQQKEQIEQQQHNLIEQNKIITSTNQQITDSINYASLIQRAALPSEGQMSSIFGSHMVIYNPLNIVSGDFYWATQVGKLKMLAVADCTGHGVPGAFLSMLGISILNDIAARATTQNLTAAAMLDQMRNIFKLALHQRGAETDNHDGIDIALLVINPEEMTLSYAGAYRPALIIREHEITKLEPDRMPIGSHYNEAEHFTEHQMKLQTGDSIYIFTDGMTDQFGYDSQNKIHKYTSKRLRTLLADIHKQPFSVQKTKIELSIESWRLDTQSATANGTPYEQTDDALLIGIRI